MFRRIVGERGHVVYEGWGRTKSATSRSSEETPVAPKASGASALAAASLIPAVYSAELVRLRGSAASVPGRHGREQ